jgi:hypothetical protein
MRDARTGIIAIITAFGLRDAQMNTELCASALSADTACSKHIACPTEGNPLLHT